MTNLELTPQQIQYLIYINQNSSNISLGTLSTVFDCSKVNAKKILDRMIRLGLLLRHENNIKLTEIGRTIAQKYSKEKDTIKTMFVNGLGVEHEIAEDSAFDLVSNMSEETKLNILHIASPFLELKKIKSGKAKTEDILNCFSSQNANIKLSIYKKTSNNDSSFNNTSMSMRAFDTNGLIDQKEKTITLNVRPIKESLSGYLSQGLLKELRYVKNSKEYSCPVKDKMCKIPIDAIEYWQNLGGGVFQTSLSLQIMANISLVKQHSHKAIFVFTISFFRQ